LNLDAIDPDQLFFIHDVEICTLLKETRDVCTQDTFGNDRMMALNYLFGGKSLDDYWDDGKSRYPGVKDDSKYKYRVLFMCEILLGMPGVLSGLEFLFKYGVIHNDISFANLMMDEKGLIRIIDFGAAIQYSTATVKDAQLHIENPDTGSKYRRFLPDLLCIYSDYQSNQITQERLKERVMQNNLSWLEDVMSRKSVKDSTFTVLDRLDSHCVKELYPEMDAWMSMIIQNTDTVQNTIRKKGGAENLRFLNSVTESYFEFADTFSLGTGMISRLSSLKFVGAAFETFTSGEAQDFLVGVYSFFLAMVSPNVSKRLGIRLAYNEYTKTFYRTWNMRLSEIIKTAKRQPEVIVPPKFFNFF
jgi:serine/threonine protein kinase